MQKARAAWPNLIAPYQLDDLHFLDETWSSTNMIRTHGYAPLGERLIGKVPQAHWKTISFVGALTTRGIVAPWALDQGMTGDWFLAYVRQILVPVLRPGNVVIMDNLSSHKVSGVQEAIESVGAKVLLLPKYSPDLNPIEKAFSKLKGLLRSAAARTVPKLYGALRKIVGKITPEESVGYLRHCGYSAAIPTSRAV